MYKKTGQLDIVKKSSDVGVSGECLSAVQVISDYLAWFSTGQPSHGTLKVRSNHLAALAAKHPDLFAVTSEDLQRHLNNPNWAQQTKKSHRSTLRSFYGWAYRYELIAKDPSADLRPIKIPVGRPRPAPEANVEAAIANASPTDQVMVLLAAYAGLRRNEIATLRQSEVEGNRLRVTGKGGRTRLVPIHPKLVEPLTQQLDRAKDHEWVFPSPVKYNCERHISPDYVSKTLKRLLGGELTAHTLRHRFATKAYQGTKDIRAVQELLGHSSPSTTAIYTLIEDDQLASAVGMIA
jgi:integrase/recombinase XerC